MNGRWPELSRNLLPVVALATIGVLVCAALVTGGFVYSLGWAGALFAARCSPALVPYVASPWSTPAFATFAIRNWAASGMSAPTSGRT